MQYVAAIDTETTGLNPKVHRVIEVGAVLWEVETKRPMLVMSELVGTTDKIPEEASKVNKIYGGDLKAFGEAPEKSFARLAALIERSQFVMGHNIRQFDLPFLKEEFTRVGIVFPDRPVIDTLFDIQYTHGDMSRKLSHIAAAHGILNPFPHRAVFDVFTMLKVASAYNFDDIIARASTPSRRIRAIVSYDNRGMAKDAGFHWDGERWIKDAKDGEQYPFPTQEV